MSESAAAQFWTEGTWVGRVWNPVAEGPSVIACRDGEAVDITSPAIATMRDLMEADDPVAIARSAPGRSLGPLAEVLANAREAPDPARPYPLAPCDLQSVKASGVTFASSMLERVIEEQAGGDPARAEAIRARCTAIVGDSLRGVVPGSAQARELRKALVAEGLWSQYLEVGIGPDAELFTKAQPMAAVGHGASVGIHPVSTWNNPEPEVVLAVDSRGRVRGAVLGNDVNLRDVEGRSALLLGKAKDQNASCAIGPMIRLFDAGFGIEEVRGLELALHVEGPDGFVLDGHSSMREISRDPLDLAAQMIGPHHQYPDGAMLFLGTMFAPTEDRDAPGQGFTHKPGDVVTISAPGLGVLVNTVRRTDDCPPWVFGTGALMRNLARRGLLKE